MFVILLTSMMALVGCGTGNESAATSSEQSEQGNSKADLTPSQPTISTEPVTLSFYIAVPLSDEEFANYFADPVKQRYPNITLEPVRSGKGMQIADLIQSGKIPDIFYAGPNLYNNDILEYDIPLDLRELIKKHQFDLAKINPQIVAGIKGFGKNGEFYSLPFSQNRLALWYNKTLFDQFGVPYPKDGMNWDDTLQLARKMTRSADGIQYRGLDPMTNNITNLASPLSLKLVDEKTGKAIVSPQWKDVFSIAMSFYQIPGNKPDSLIKPIDTFEKDKKIAMIPYWYNEMISSLENTGLDWDVVQLPDFKEAPGMGSQVDWHQLIISKQS
jgi:multiple sugar transport system substrate-binding protein